jgi:uncharacterized repeat protein (TIGR03843 family)
MDSRVVLEVLLKGTVALQGKFLRGSNGTFLVEVQDNNQHFQAVYKPKAGEQPLWDFPSGTLGKREVATYLFGEALGWKLVPPTVYRDKAPLGPGSLQLFIPHSPDDHYFQISKSHTDIIRKILLFDFMLNNADRKAGHFIMDRDKHIWLIDHGLTFNIADKLRTVAWDYAGEKIPADLLSDIKKVLYGLDKKNGIHQQLKIYLTQSELDALAARMMSLLEDRYYPVPPGNRRIIPWPPI